MLTPKAQKVFDDYEFHNMLIHRFVDGVTHEESILQLPFEHNCMNWILGHIVTNRSQVLETLKVQHAWKLEVRKLYHTETPPIWPESNSVQFDVLIQYLNESLALLKFGLDAISDEQLEETHTNYRGEKTRYAHITGFHWHESFHLGQLEILKAFIESKR
jgi:hypothetical protein